MPVYFYFYSFVEGLALVPFSSSKVLEAELAVTLESIFTVCKGKECG